MACAPIEVRDMEQIETKPPGDNLAYVQMIATQGGIIVTDEKQLELAKLTDRNEINKALFEILAVQPPKAKMDLGPLLSRMESFIEDGKVKLIDQAVRNEINALSNVRRYENGVRDALRELSNYRDMRLSLEDDKNKTAKTIEDEIRIIEASPRWVINLINNSEIVFKVASPVIIRHVDEPKAIDMTVNFGEMRVVWKPASNLLKVLNGIPVEHYVDSYYHPHVSDSGTVCWGNAADTVTKALNEFKISKVLSILDALLSSYNDESPYRTISEFWFMQNRDKLTDTEHDFSYASRLWVRRSYADDTGITWTNTSTREDDDGEEIEIAKVSYYYKRFKKYGVIDTSIKFVKLDDDTFVELDEDEVMDD